jgi:putative ABC transport system ATP-binding protein
MTLECRDVVVEYSGGGYVVRPIDELSLDVESGELALLLGASGCGKTTLLSILAAILRPKRGSVLLNGREVTGLTGGALTEYRRHSVGLVFQTFNLVPSLTAAENVQIPLRAAGLGARRARRRAEGLLAQVGMGGRASHRPGELSGGEQQRVAIARALALDPPLLLADEPTAHLDYIQIEGVLRLLREIADEGRMVVVATHDERIVPLADRTIELTPRRPEDLRSRGEVTLTEGEVLFRQGDVSDLVYVVEEGQIELVRALARGGEQVLARHARGEYFGELGPMFKLPRSATARAATPCRLIGLPIGDFRRSLQRQHPERPSR